MPVSASITFEQNATTAGAGISMVGVGGDIVTLTNHNNAGIIKWTWELLDAPIGSALVPSVVSTSSTASFTPDSLPDTPGCYRFKLTVLGADGSGACDVKNFCVPTEQGWILPPFKATASELNFTGNEEGWESLLNQIFLDISTGVADKFVKVTSSDTTTSYLDSKIVAGSGLHKTIINPGSNEQIELAIGPGEVFTVDLVLPLSGVTSNVFNWLGELRINSYGRSVAPGQTGTYSTPFDVSNNRVSLNVNSLTGSGTATITGSTIDLTTKVVTSGDTETITIDATGRYKTENEWWDCSSITFSAGITAIDYDVDVIGYMGAGNVNFAVLGYRIDAYSQATNPAIGFEMYKIQDDGDKKCSLVPLESIGIKGSGTGPLIVDSLRTGASDRSYDPPYVVDVWGSKKTAVLEQQDFYSYFTGGENIVLSSTSQEGLVVHIRGEDGSGGGNISSVDFVNLFLILQRL